MKHHITETLIKSADKHYSKKLSTNQRVFIREYYHRLPDDDYSPAATEELITAALKHRGLGAIRKSGETLFDIYNIDSILTNPEPCTVLDVVTDDRPFLVDTLTILLNNRNFTIHRTIHPVFQVKRSKANGITSIKRFHPEDEEQGGKAESFIQFHLDYLPSSAHEQLAEAVSSVVNDIKTVVEDWAPMRGQLLSLAVELEDNKGLNREYSSLLRWLENHHFAMLGYCEFNLSGSKKQSVVRVDKPSALGFMRVLREKGSQRIQDFLPPLDIGVDNPVTITKARQRSTIHRSAFMDCILVSQPRGKSKGRRICCILGLFSAAAFVRPTKEIPLLRENSAWVLKQSTLRQGSYAYKALKMIIENLPRESLFHMDRDSLYQLSMDVLNHQERRRTSVYIHQDQCGHFYSCLVYVPRDLYHSDLRLKIEDYLTQELDGGEVLFDVYFSDSILTRIHFIVHTKTGKPVRHDLKAIEKTIQIMSRDWNDSLRIRLSERYDPKQSRNFMLDYADAFSGSYRDDFKIQDAVKDIENIGVCVDNSINSTLYLGERDGKSSNRLKIYSCAQQVPLSDMLPILENLGLRVIGERPYRVRRQQGSDVWLHDFEIVREDGKDLDLDADSANLRETLFRVWCGDAENDGFNQLVLDTGMDWRKVMMLRACFRYLRQIRLRYSQDYVIDALKTHRSIVIELAKLFELRFHLDKNPGEAEKRDTGECEATISGLLEQVESLDEDRILSALRDVIMAMLRTNYYQQDDAAQNGAGKSKPYLSFKINSQLVPRLPEPRPKYEIYVYSPRFEGIHLRGGDVARGGLRWSDRLEDYRTEVLGLVKAQMVKNAVIVPVGSKGGFVPRRLPTSGRDEVQKEVISCYQLFIMGLLDLTDNLSANEVVPPSQVVRYDHDDPYLVVAADKGTATFSDIANEISESRNFWLGDAFASGGSMGYDHKKMGITARGAWESVKRLFRQRGKDIQTTDFTVAGIGDMAGDVFGNGMLLSEHIQLQVAFNHMHIFIDPTPDAAVSHAERKRLFELPRSSWTDYNSKLISKGGGIFERKAKSIGLTTQMKKMLDTKVTKCSPTELINLILKMPVELLWNGGIGTYIKASNESQSDAQDKANDALRVDATELRCAVIGEGGNLGMTQNARIEYSLHGGLCNTDAIDNSAGVDTSDHEVNIKILFNRAIEDGSITRTQRNKLLAGMEEEVGKLVLRNNYDQNQTISVAAHFGEQLMPQHINSIKILEQRGLNRKIEYLPDNAELIERAETGIALTRPELSVLLSYSKMDLYEALLNSDVPDDSALSGEIEAYFPSAMRRRFKDYIHSHRLKREIIATHLTNRFIGQMGLSFHLTLSGLMGVPGQDVARAWFIAQDIMQSTRLVAEIEALDNQVDSSLQLECLFNVASMLEKTIVWLLKHHPSAIDINTAIKDYGPLVKAVDDQLDEYLSAADKQEIQNHQTQLTVSGVPARLAAELARLPYRAATLEIAGISISSSCKIEIAASTYFQVHESLGLGWTARSIARLPVKNEWHERARFALAADLISNHSAITCNILNNKSAKSSSQVEDWLSEHRAGVENIQSTAEQLKVQDKPDFPMLSVLMSGLSQLA
jgi:glutamate dehydrogenase